MDEQTKLFIEISRNLGEMNSKLGSLCETIAKHEVRLTELEREKRVSTTDWRNGVIELLVKALIIGLVSVASLAGGGSILFKLFGG